MGTVDQSDAKSHIMKLSAERVEAWHQKQLAFLIETAISWAHGNYNLDASVTNRESFSEFYYKLMVELQDMSPNLRVYKNPGLMSGKKRTRAEVPQSVVRSPEVRSHKKKTTPQRGRKIQKGVATAAGLNCYGRKNLAKYLRFFS